VWPLGARAIGDANPCTARREPAALDGAVHHSGDHDTDTSDLRVILRIGSTRVVLSDRERGSGKRPSGTMVRAWLRRALADPASRSGLRRFLASRRPGPVDLLDDDAVVARIASLCDAGVASVLVDREAGGRWELPPGEPVEPEDDTALGPSPEPTWLEIEMVGEDRCAARGVSYRLEAADGTPYEGVLDDRGFARLEDLPGESWRIAFPGLDAEAWSLLERMPARTTRLQPSGALWSLGDTSRESADPFRHQVAYGECASSIAFRYGFDPRTLWDHAENAALRRTRGDPHVLLAGDEVFIPSLRGRSVTVEAGRRHRFLRHGVPEQFRIRLLDEDKPRAGVAYELEIDGVRQRGSTDADGWIAAWISPDARRGVLLLGADERYELNLGRLDPLEAERGVIARLRNLGYVPVDNEEENALYVGLLAFQRDNGLSPTGQADDTTRQALRSLHGS
jgi:hypothetical protein